MATKNYRFVGNLVEQTLGTNIPVDIPFAMSFGSVGAPPPPPPPPPPGNNITGDIVDTNNAVVEAAWLDMAYNYAGLSKGLPYRWGPAATKTGVQTLPQRADISSILYGSSARVYYQYGAESLTGINDFVTSNGAAIYTPDTGVSTLNAVGRFCTYQIDRHTISQRPQLMWQSPQLVPPQVEQYISAGLLNTADPADLPIFQFRPQLPADGGADKMSVVATQGSATKGSLIYCVGTATADQLGSVRLPVGKVPTCAAITSGGEYMFVPLWDTTSFRAQVAVIALGGVPAGRSWQDTTNWYDWWHDWLDMTHPGLKNKGGWAFLKILGYVNLPTNMKAPTCCHATTGLNPIEVVYHVDPATGQLDPSSFMKESSPLENNRANMLPGGQYYQWFAKGGLLVVGSKSEKTVCFIDITPLFTYVNDMYFGTALSNLETQYYQLHGSTNPNSGIGAEGGKYLNDVSGEVFRKVTGSWTSIGNIGAGHGLGMANNQWPYQLTDKPQSTPVVIKTVQLTDEPIGIRSPISYNYWSKDSTRRQPGTPGYPMADPHYCRIWVVGRTGTMHIYSTGRWVPGPYPADQAPSANEISEVGTVTGMGEQITYVGSVKDYDIDTQGVIYHEQDAPPGCLDESVMVVDRKNRRINWYQFAVTTGTSAALIGSLEDSRMDPTTADHVDGYYKSNKVILVCDYSGKRMLTYRARTPIPLNYEGTAYPTIAVGGEYGGALTVPGTPFEAFTSNSP